MPIIHKNKKTHQSKGLKTQKRKIIIIIIKENKGGKKNNNNKGEKEKSERDKKGVGVGPRHGALKEKRK